jgi:hypothetical protein
MKKTIVAAGTLFVLSIAQIAPAGDRLFTGVYEAQTSPAGTLEFEQWVTWKTHKQADQEFQRFDFRHEVEYSVTDDWMLALYLSDWRAETSDGSDISVEWRNVALETIYMFLNPAEHPVGLAGYFEVKGGDELFAIEGKLLVQMNLDKWTAVWNGVIESEWEGSDLEEHTGVLEQTAGISYELSPRIRLGVELKHEVECADWQDWEKPLVYLGPAISFRKSSWFTTITPSVQLTHDDTSPDYVTRLIFGISL